MQYNLDLIHKRLMTLKLKFFNFYLFEPKPNFVVVAYDMRVDCDRNEAYNYLM